MSKSLNFALVFVLVGGTAMAGPLGLGRPAEPEEIAAWDIDVRPDGQGLPAGAGDVYTGEEIFIERCAVCHGDFGEGAGRWPVLAGGLGSLTRDRPVKTIGSYWPYLSTVYDYIHRTMPFGDAQSLSADETYALVAYLMYLNNMVEDDFELSDSNFNRVEMPNADGFFFDDRPETEYPLFTEACMTDCKPGVEITGRASVLDVTPDSGGVAEDGTVIPAAETATPEPEPEPEPEAAPIDAALAAAGEQVFRKCQSCHQVGEGARTRTGPILNGVVGALPASNPDFGNYSSGMEAMRDEGRVWDAEALDAYLTRPRDFVPGTRMSFAGLRSAEDRAAVIEYLRSFPAQ
ncbi:MAG: c-type cytochrome [Paracoccaceae bacterium]